MNWTIVAFGSSFLLFAFGCSQGDRLPRELVDCSVADAYEFLNISNFDPTESGWFRYADPTPGGAPNTAEPPSCSNVPVTELTVIGEPERCGDNRMLRLQMEGKNFWGSGFGDWQHNSELNRAPDGTDHEGISFWARSPANAEKQFFLNVDDSRTIILPPEVPGPMPEPNTCAPPQPDVLPEATSADQDLDGDGLVGPGDIARETDCRLPPPSELGEATCYNGGVDGPASAGVRVPAPDECGNAFHTRITTTETWQLFLIPWDELVQWPCPNRLEGGIDREQIRKFEIKLDQGMTYDIWLDNIAFYRQRRD